MISFVAVTATAPVAEAASTSCSGSTCTVTFGNAGSFDTWTVPAGVTSVNFNLYGAGGGIGGNDGRGRGDTGYAGYIYGTVSVTPGTVIYIALGVGGGSNQVCQANGSGGSAGSNYFGYNGGVGGNSGVYGCSGPGGGGGGASVLRIPSSRSAGHQ